MIFESQSVFIPLTSFSFLSSTHSCMFNLPLIFYVNSQLITEGISAKSLLERLNFFLRGKHHDSLDYCRYIFFICLLGENQDTFSRNISVCVCRLNTSCKRQNPVNSATHLAPLPPLPV